MKRYYSILSLLVILNSCSDDPVGADEIDLAPEAQKKWTFILYDDADFDRAYNPISDFAGRVSSNKDINYIVLCDRNSNAGTVYYKILENHNPEIMHEIPEVNMGDQSTVENALGFVKKYFPAERYMIGFYDHGGGWRGACWDVTNGNDNLTPAEINNCLSKQGGVDIIMFTAPCLMGSIESAYQMRNSAQYYIGSANTSGFIYWTGMWEDFDSYIKNNPDVETKQLSKKIIELHYKNRNAYNYGSTMTMSSIESSKLNAFVNKFNQLLDEYNDSNINVIKNTIALGLKTYYEEYADLGDFLLQLEKGENSDKRKRLAMESYDLLMEAIVAECHGHKQERSKGVNIFLPPQTYGSDLYFAPYGIGLEFKDACKWDELLMKVLPNSVAKVEFNLQNLFLSDGNIPIYFSNSVD